MKNLDSEARMKIVSQLMLKVFDEELCNQILKAPLKSFKWEDDDLHHYSVCTNGFNIAKTFTPENLAKEKDNRTQVELFLSKVYVLGYEAGYIENRENYDLAVDAIKLETAFKIVELQKEVDELKKKLS